MFQSFVHGLNRSGTSLLPHIIDTRPTTCATTTCTAAVALLHTLNTGASMLSNMENPDRCLSYALQWLVSPELKLKPEQWSAIEFVYREKDVFV